MTDLMHVMYTATKCEQSWSNKNKALFHAFNPNGVVSAKYASDKVISELADQGFCKWGATLAYGSGNSFHAEKLIELASVSGPKRVSSFDVTYFVEEIQKDIDGANRFVEKIKACI
jgi:hypothetical protein